MVQSVISIYSRKQKKTHVFCNLYVICKMLHDLIVYTDIGDDIDDSLALWYIHQQHKVRNLVIVLYSYELTKRIKAWELIEPFFIQKPIVIQ